MGRAPCCDKANVKKGPWSPEEDAKLRDYIEKFGTGGNWIALPQKAGLKRCGKSCRLRWLNYLRPNIKHGEFSDEEDRIICTLYASIGSRWSIIAAQLPGRTDNDIKNYWNTKLKKKLMGITTTPKKSSLTPSTPSSSYIMYHDQLHHHHQFHDHQLNHNPTSSSSPYLHQCTGTTYYNSPSSSNTMSFTTFDTMHNYPNNHNLVKDSNTLLMFGDQTAPSAPSCSSSDGSNKINHHQVKREDHGINIAQPNYDQEMNKLLLSSGNNSLIWGQNQNSSMLAANYGLEEIKELISTNINVNDGDESYNYFDDNKTDEENSKQLMYYY